MNRATLQSLVRAMATTPIARQFIEEYSEELSDNPVFQTAAQNVATLASRSKVVTPQERSAGIVLFGLIREAFDTELSGPKNAKSLRDEPPAPTPGTTPVLSRETFQLPKPPPTASKPEIQGVRIRDVATESPARAKKVREKQTLSERLQAAPMGPLPEIRTNPVSAKRIPIMTEAFFRDARHVSVTQYSDGLKREGQHMVKGDGTEVFVTKQGEEKQCRNQGLRAADVLTRHRDLIGASREGKDILQRFAVGQLNATAALDSARRTVMELFRRTTGQVLSQETIRHWEVYPVHGSPSPELREARTIASVPVRAAVRRGKEWEPIKVPSHEPDRREIPMKDAEAERPRKGADKLRGWDRKPATPENNSILFLRKHGYNASGDVPTRATPYVDIKVQGGWIVGK